LVSVPLDTYIKMIELKTSILLHGAMKMGALIGGATELDAEYVAEFGRTMGIAFQLQDDYLDSFGDEATFGKRIGGDIVQNKKTFLFLKALELSSDTQREELLHWYNNAVETEREAQKIEAVKTIFTTSGAVAAIEVEIEKYRQLALTTMEKVAVANDKKMGLLMFLDYIMQRQH
jgi:geranylgeranyl diphosphate synthase, type II